MSAPSGDDPGHEPDAEADGFPRRLAAAILRAVAHMAPPASKAWAAAMLRELDFIQGDWAALYWALGSAGAILRHVASALFASLKTKSKEGNAMNSTGKKALGVGLGVVSAIGLAGSAMAMLRLVSLLWPGAGHDEWTRWIMVIIVPEAVFIAAAVLLWRRKGPIAAGILTVALLIGTHVAVHLAMR